MRTERTSSISGGSACQLVPFELEEVSQYSHWSVPLQKPNSLVQEPFLLLVPRGQWDGDWTVWTAESVGRISASCQWGGEQTQGGGGRLGVAMRGNISLPFLSHLKHCVPHSLKETIYRQVFLIFYRECSTQRFSNVASKTQGLVSGEVEKDTMQEVQNKPQSKYWVRNWKMK